MLKSYERINYKLRPAKSIERKMLCESFQRLINIADLTKYRYIGFSSIYFSDFCLIHKSLGLTDMISIEKEERDKERFRFNRPYNCIKFRFGDSNDVLPTISWSKKVITWLDYDYKLEEGMLTDIGTFFTHAQAGSVIIITVDVSPDELPTKNNEKNRFQKLEERISKNKIPIEVEEKDLDKQNNPRICYNILNNEIDEILAKRNWGLENTYKLTYKQLFNFLYKDGSSPMLSIGGIIFSDKDRDNINKCNFEGLGFIRSQREVFEPYKINVPNLTFNEMRYLDKYLPLNTITGLSKKAKIKFLPNNLIDQYHEIYKYIPNFVETEIH